MTNSELFFSPLPLPSTFKGPIIIEQIKCQKKNRIGKLNRRDSFLNCGPFVAGICGSYKFLERNFLGANTINMQYREDCCSLMSVERCLLEDGLGHIVGVFQTIDRLLERFLVF